MKRKVKAIVARSAGELAEVLGLDRADGIEFAVRSALNAKIVEVIAKRGPTHAEVAGMAGTSRTRVTAIVNRNTKDVSTDLMLRVLGALGVVAKISFGRAAQRATSFSSWQTEVRGVRRGSSRCLTPR